ncbi:MAG: type IX secretion system sortase PorU [Flavobacteriaceae bacterium]
MGRTLFIALFCCSVFVFGQQKHFKLQWGASKKISGASYSITVPAFDETFFNFNFNKGLQFVAQWETSSPVVESSITVTNVAYASIQKSELFDLDITSIPEQLEYSLTNSVARDKRYAFFSLSPIIKDGASGYKKVVSFTVLYAVGGSSDKIGTVKAGKTAAITNSVLSSGEWYRFYIDTTGVFKLSKNFLGRLGVNVNNIDPRTIKIYGNGGDMLPYSNAANYPLDVQENAVKFIGEGDGVFNNNDYILFYGKGPKNFNAESNTHINCYTDKTYYYVNVSPGNGKRIQTLSEPAGVVDLEINTFQDYQFHEIDEHNIGHLGRRWFGDAFDVETSKTFEFNFPDLDVSVPVNLKVYVAATATTSSAMQVSVNGASVANLSMTAVNSPDIGNDAAYNGQVQVALPTIAVTLDYDNQGNPSVVGYLDYIAIEATRQLRFGGQQFQFKNKDVTMVSGICQYNLTNTQQLAEVWDITDIFNVSSVSNTENTSNFSFKATMGSLKTYVAMGASGYFEPKADNTTSISNQNIKGTIFLNSLGEFQDVDYIIVAPNNMLAQAQRLAQINTDKNGLNVRVLGLNEIYNEFSSGNPDIAAIRNMVKYVYDNASSSENRLKYLCLFGDSSFDYKNRIPNNTNIVPSWHALSSFSIETSYVSDDFFGMMDANEGTMRPSDKLDIAVGRILAGSPQQAKEMVDKIEDYYAKEAFGPWRNRFVVVSDDVDKNWEGVLQETIDNAANAVMAAKPFMNAVKIHSDAYKQEVLAGGERYPQVNTVLRNAIDKGALVVNYFGHGGEEGLAQERIFLKTDADNLNNNYKLNCFVAVTCEFTRFDNPYRQTAGEFTYWNKTAGAVGLITTTRQINVNFAIPFNSKLGEYLFSYSNNDTYPDYEYPSMAEALRLVKNDASISEESQKAMVFFMGDPAMKLAFPQPNIRLTKINDVPIAQATDTLKALSHIKLAGEVVDVSGNLLSNYNGTLSTTIYDKEIERQTLANDGIRLNGQVVRLDFKTLGEIIFRGQSTISNGQFEFDFVVPKDIGIPVGFGKVSFYAKNESITEDQTGASINTVKIGGVNENAAEDNTGPTITLYMNDESFVSGGITNESPTLLAYLEDLNGINTASGIGHDIVAFIDGDETNPFILNDYYETELDNYQKGLVTFPFHDLEPGLHTLTLRAWDVYNNSATAEIQFVVYDEDQELVVNNVLNYPNPFVNYTEFWFNHNSSAPLNVLIQVFTVSGKLVRTLSGQTSGGNVVNSSLSRDIVWDGRDDFGDKIGKGVYVYKLTVESTLINKKVEKIQKLVIL